MSCSEASLGMMCPENHHTSECVHLNITYAYTLTGVDSLSICP